MIKIGGLNINTLFLSLMLEALKISGLVQISWFYVALPLLIFIGITALFIGIIVFISLIIFIFTGELPYIKVGSRKVPFRDAISVIKEEKRKFKEQKNTK